MWKVKERSNDCEIQFLHHLNNYAIVGMETLGFNLLTVNSEGYTNHSTQLLNSLLHGCDSSSGDEFYQNDFKTPVLSMLKRHESVHEVVLT